MTFSETISGILSGIYNGLVRLLGFFGFSPEQSKYVIFIGIFATVILAYVLNERNKRRKKAAAVRNIIREMKDAVRRSVETLDSRTQWVFQEDDELFPAKKVYKQLLDLEEKWDWTLTGRYEMRKDEMEEAWALITQWVEKKPNYDTKAQYLRDMAKVGDILKRW
ncbi:MAG: hypothetical protein V3R82_01910 [Candidatus Hydrothermarchaeales archaeon]